MENTTKVSKDYIESFNQGYQLAKELNIKPEILKGLNAGNNRMQAMKEGMQQYQTDKALDKAKGLNKDVIPPLDMDSIDSNYIDLNEDYDNKDLDIEI